MAAIDHRTGGMLGAGDDPHEHRLLDENGPTTSSAPTNAPSAIGMTPTEQEQAEREEAEREKYR